MEIIKSDIQITLTKTQLVDIIQEALATDAGPAIKRAITPMLAEAFPQFPEFTTIKFSDTQNEDGSVEITLSKPKSKPKAKVESEPKPESDLKSMEPLDVAEPESEPAADPFSA